MRMCICQLLLFSLAFLGTSQGQELPQPPAPGSSKWGPEDERGSANLITPAKVLGAVRLIKEGQVYQLGSVYEEGTDFHFDLPHLGQTLGQGWLEMELQSFFEVSQGLLLGLSLTRNVDVQALSHEPLAFLGD